MFEDLLGIHHHASGIDFNHQRSIINYARYAINYNNDEFAIVFLTETHSSKLKSDQRARDASLVLILKFHKSCSELRVG